MIWLSILINPSVLLDKLKVNFLHRFLPSWFYKYILVPNHALGIQPWPGKYNAPLQKCPLIWFLIIYNFTNFCRNSNFLYFPKTPKYTNQWHSDFFNWHVIINAIFQVEQLSINWGILIIIFLTYFHGGYFLLMI